MEHTLPPTEEAFGEPIIIGNNELIPVREDFRLMNLEALEEVPKRMRGKFRFDGIDSLLAFTRKHQTKTAFAMADVDDEVTIYLSGMITDEPSWLDYSASMKLDQHPWLSEWVGISGRSQSQQDFGEYIESHIEDVIEPAAANLLEMVTTLQAKQKVSFKSAKNLHNGDSQIQYEETTDANAGAKGDMRIPNTIKLQLPVFRQAPDLCFEFTARFKFSIREGRLSFAITLHRPELAKDAAREELMEAIRKAAGIPVYSGSLVSAPMTLVSRRL